MGTTETKRLIRRFHALLRSAGMGEEAKRDLLESYGVEHTTELTDEQLERICRFVERMVDGEAEALNAQRKRLISAICRYCEAVDVKGWGDKSDEERVAYAKGIACKAAQVGPGMFNRLGMERMKGLTYSFSKRAKDMDSVVAMAEELVRD